MVSRSSEGFLLADACDPSLPIVYANPAYEDLSGYSLEELTGSSWSLATRDCDGQPELERLRAAIGRSEPCRLVLTDLRKDGTVWFSHVSVEPLYNARGELRYFLCTQRPAVAVSAEALGDALPEALPSGEISLLQRELGRAQQKIASLNRIDSATGLLQFGYFQETLRRDMAIARRDHRTVTLLVFDIVEFDVYRETFGSKAADSCQRMIGAQITRTLRRAGDLCARYEDSTLVASVLGQTESDAQRLAEQIAEKVRRLGLHNPRAKSGRYITIRTASVGCPSGTEEDPDTMIARARDELRARSEDGPQSAAF
jgi:diguanylate cyclase (GGDEF)-like protein/PAS domain S-box-containing protein